MTESGVILIVEDSEDDVVLMRRVLAATAALPIVAVENGQQAIDYLSGVAPYENRREHPLPTVVFLDLKLPLRSGHEVLAWIRAQPGLEGLPVVVLTSSGEPSDLRRSYRLGASSHLVKPLTRSQLEDLGRVFNWSWIGGRIRNGAGETSTSPVTRGESPSPETESGSDTPFSSGT